MTYSILNFSILGATNGSKHNLLNYWNEIDWDFIIDQLITRGVSLVIIIIAIYAIKIIGTKIISRMFNNYRLKEEFSSNRLETLHKLTQNAFQYTLYFFFIYALLSIIGVPVGSLIAGAGIAGIAIGLGAQGFINDLLTGFFIILERQIDVGDHVIIDKIEGYVQSIGLRTTQVKSADGTLHYIPNGQILIVSNLSRENMLALIKLRIKPGTDMKLVNQLISDVDLKIVGNYPEIADGPHNLGLIDLGNGNLAVKIAIYTASGSQLKIQAEFLEAYISALTSAGIELPQPAIQTI